MGDIKSTVSKAENESEEPNNDGDKSQDTNSRAKILRSMANEIQKKRTADICGSSSSTLSTTDKNLLTVCKPISVRLTRLPDAVINKFVKAAEERARKRKKAMWKVGICYKARSRRLLKQKKQRHDKGSLLKWLQSGSSVKVENAVEKAKLEEIGLGDISKISESATIEESPNEKSELPTQSVAPPENAIHKSAECTEKNEANIEIPTLSELSESELQITAKTPSEIFPNKPEQRSFPEISDNIEIRLATKIPQNLANATIQTTEISSASSPVVPPETNNNQNRKISCKRLLEENRRIAAKLRKRTLQSDDETDGPQSHLSKKHKSSRASMPGEEKAPKAEKNDSESLKSVPNVKKFAGTKICRAGPKSRRRRSVHTEKIVLREVKVVLCRLEDSQDPLVLEWSRKNSPTRKDVISTERRPSLIKTRAAVVQSSEIGAVVAGVPITSLENLSGNLDISQRFNEPEESDTDVLPKECAAFEASEETSKTPEEEDDDEVAEFLRRHRKVRPSIDSSSSGVSSNSQAYLPTRVLRSKTPTVNVQFLEKLVKSPAAVKAPRLRIRERSTSTDSFNSEAVNNHNEIPEPLRQESSNTPLLRKRESSEIAGVPITSLENLSRNLDVSKRFNEPEESDTDLLPKECTSAALEAATAVPIACEESSKIPEEEDDDEIVQFLRRHRKVRPSIDSSSSADSSNPQASLPTRVLRSKTPTVNGAFLEKLAKSPVAMKTQRLRIRERSTSTDSSNNEAINNHNAIPEPLRQESSNFSLLRGGSSTSRTSDGSVIRQEPRRPPSSRRKAFHVAVEKIIVNDAERLNLALSASINDFGNQVNPPNGQNSEAGIANECKNSSAASSANFVTCGQNAEDQLSADSRTEVNRDFTDIENANSGNCNEDLVARRKLTAVRNAMVVLTRLEDLDVLSEDNQYSVNEMEFNTAEDFGFSRSSTPDPLDISRNDSQHSSRETENSIVPSFTGAVRVSPRKTLRSDVQSSQESQESDVEMHLGLEDAYSQETIESDVEMTLVFEENSSQETEDSDAELPMSEVANRSRLPPGDEDEGLDVVVLEGEKAAKSQANEAANSLQSSSAKSQNPPEGILTDARSNSGDSRKVPDDNEDLDSHCKRCSCEEHKSDKRRLNCQNIPGLYKCVTCRIIFKDAATLEAHKSSSLVCSSGFLCTLCEASFSTLNDLTTHRISCVTKVPQKQTCLDDSKDAEETAEAENPPNAENSVTKANHKSESYQKVLSRRMRARKGHPIDNLKCGVCSITFGTTQALSEHIFKHNTEELQQAYKNAKAKAIGDSKTSKAALAQQKEKPSAEKTAPKLVALEAHKDKSLPQESSAETPLAIPTTVANRDANAKAATVCFCHRDKNPACPDKTDLQIEMVLLCQYCMVIFRRRECFEVHYRTSPQCATDRSRGRSPKLYCANCQSTLNSWAGMRRHLEVHASLNVEGTVRFVCNICRVIFVGFGALFYNHWSSHLKDTMFVASRYSFPKNSVQPIDGIPKLPIGASAEESYIIVAEHVCSNCKKPFSTRRDMEVHEKSKSCVEPEQGEAQENQWHCDLCNIRFISRRALNKHSQEQHAQRFLCVSTSPLTPAFMCTRCFAMRKLVVEIEEHWKTALQHDTPLGFIGNEALTDKTIVTDDASNGLPNENETAKKSALDASADGTEAIISLDKSKSKNVEQLIDISESIDPEITCVFQSPTKSAGTQTTCVSNQESHSTSPKSSESSSRAANSCTMLRNLLGPSSTPDNAQRTKTRALEDNSVDIVLSDVSESNVSAKLVINESRTNSGEERNGNRSIDSYKIVMTPRAASGNAQLEKVPAKTAETAQEGNNEDSTDNTSDMAVVTVCEPKLSEKEDSGRSSPQDSEVSARTSDTAGVKRNRKLSEIAASKKSDSAVNTWFKQKLSDVRSARAKKQLPASGQAVPEVIDLSDDQEEAEAPPAATKPKTSTPTSVITKNGAKPIGNKSGSGKSKKSASKSKSAAKPRSLNDSGASNSDAYPFVLDTAEKSFEEVRFADYTRSKESAQKDSAGAKKPGFLRVKNLSELQAIKIHNCLNCNTVFDTPTALEEHYRSRLCAPLEKRPETPKGITGALILPDNPSATSTQALPTVYAAGNVVTQQLIGIDPGLGVISGVPVSSVIVNNETAGSWITVGGQHDSMPSVALMNTSSHSLSGGALLMNLGGQQSANGNPNAIMTTSIATSTASIGQTQDILVQQQQHQYPQPQQYQPQQQPQYQPQPILGINQQLTDNPTAQLGFHVMPAMVLPQTTQINKQQCTESVLRNPSTPNLPLNGHINGVPFTYNSNKPNRYLCSICSAYSCNSIGTMNVHVMKHYTGFNNPANQNPSQSPTGGVSNVGFQAAKEKNSQNVALRGKGQETNVAGNPVKDSVFLKNTPQGLVWVTSVATQVANQQPGSSARQENRQIEVARSVVRGRQVVYRCLICKCAMYRDYPPLRNHVVLVHGIKDLIAAGLDNIVQKIYLCTYCPYGSTMYDSEESHRQHVDACHCIACACGRPFANFQSLEKHMTGCAGANDANNAADKNC